MNVISLTRKQLMQIGQIAEQFSNIEEFVIESNNTSGIGSDVTIEFECPKVIGNPRMRIDITDVSSW
jgi:hypothetical protein